MPLGVVDEKEFNSELEKLTDIRSDERSKVVDIERGRTIGKKEIPEEKRKEIATEAIEGNLTGIEIAQKHDVSTASVAAYKNGATSSASYNTPDESLKKHTDEVRTTITESARSKLMIALEQITSDKVAGAKIRDIAGIAKDMSAVMRNVEPQMGITNNNQVVVYRPRMRDEDEFEVICVAE